MRFHRQNGASGEVGKVRRGVGIAKRTLRLTFRILLREFESRTVALISFLPFPTLSSHTAVVICIMILTATTDFEKVAPF